MHKDEAVRGDKTEAVHRRTSSLGDSVVDNSLNSSNIFLSGDIVTSSPVQAASCTTSRSGQAECVISPLFQSHPDQDISSLHPADDDSVEEPSANAVTGNCANAVTGNCANAVTHDCANAVTGNCANAVTHDCGNAVTHDCGNAVTGGVSRRKCNRVSDEWVNVELHNDMSTSAELVTVRANNEKD